MLPMDFHSGGINTQRAYTSTWIQDHCMQCQNACTYSRFDSIRCGNINHRPDADNTMIKSKPQKENHENKANSSKYLKSHKNKCERNDSLKKFIAAKSPISVNQRRALHIMFVSLFFSVCAVNSLYYRRQRALYNNNNNNKIERNHQIKTQKYTISFWAERLSEQKRTFW